GDRRRSGIPPAPHRRPLPGAEEGRPALARAQHVRGDRSAAGTPADGRRHARKPHNPASFSFANDSGKRVDSTAMTTATPLDAADALRGAGLRVTAQRVAVLESLAGHPHAAVDELHTAVRDRIPG